MNPPAKILLVEDDSAIVATLRRVLADEGYEVAIEKTGNGGLDRAKENPFDAVITDLKLPGLSGLELVRELHAARPRLPIAARIVEKHGGALQYRNLAQGGAAFGIILPVFKS